MRQPVRRRTRRLVGAALAVTVLGVSACSNQVSPRQKRAAEGGSSARVRVLADGTQQITIRAVDMRFDPSTIIARTGTIVVTVDNAGNDPHTFEIPTLHVDTHNIPAHQNATVRFTVDKPGTYSFDCAYHIQNGMLGTLQVTG